MPRTKPRVAFIGTGGSISSPGRDPLDLFEYGDFGGGPVEVDALLAMFPGLFEAFDIVPVRFRKLRSPAITPGDWLDLAREVGEVARRDPAIDGMVITHGTSTLEETAYFLHLTVKVDVPVVVVGAQRPPTGLGTDAPLNLLNAARVAAAPAARDLGVLVVMNDEIQSAREVTKTSNYRLQTFRTPDFGTLGSVDPDGLVSVYRRPARRHAPDTEFDVLGRTELPLVDIAYSYAGADGRVVRHLAATGTRCIVSAAQSPGTPAPGEVEALAEALAQGVTVVLSSRAGSGRVLEREKDRAHGFITADNLNPQKARVLAMLALTVTEDRDGLSRIFREY